MMSGYSKRLVRLAAVLYAALSVVMGCDFHPEHTVTFNADGGTPGTQTRTVSDGGTVGEANMPTEPTKDGYAFAGWYTVRNSGGEQFTGATRVTDDMTAYARWTAEYTVTFDADGGEPITQTKTVGDGLTLGDAMPTEPTKGGYAFGGWYTMQNGNGDQFTESTPVTANITVYAKWASLYTVTFDADGGSPTSQAQTVGDGLTLGENMPPEPSKSDYAFAGWYTAKNGGGTAFIASTPVVANITVYAKWASLYTVTFDADGGSPTPQAQTVGGGLTLGENMPSEPTKSNYAFAGWYTVKNGSGTAFTASTLVTANITVYAKWASLYTVTFDADGGNPATQTKTVGGGLTLGENMPTEPGKSGFIFAGWYTAKNGGGTAFIASTLVTANITVYAKWASLYTVTFDADGGNPATQTKTVRDGLTLGENMPSEPSKSGFAFAGWYTTKNGDGTTFTASTAVTASITVYAKWASLYTVTFDADGGNPTSQTKTVGGGLTIGENMPTEPTKSGYAFNGWYTAKNGGGAQFIASTTVTATMTVYAKWSCTITFDADGGEPATQTQTVSAGGTLGASNMPENPTRNGYAFNGWYTAKDGGGTQFTASTTVNAAMTVYAKWTSLYTVTFDADGGNPATQTKMINDGGALGDTMPSDPTRDGYTFDGWYTAKNGGGTAFIASTTVTATMTIYAKWSCTITFDADGGEPATQTQTASAGGTLGENMPTDPTRSGYTFGGWYTEQNGGGAQFTASTTITATMTVYAMWTVVQMPSNLSLEASLAWISENAAEGKAYTITLKNNETTAPKTLSYDGKNISITIAGDTAERWVLLSSNGSLFTVDNGVTLTLGNNVTLQGRSANTAGLIKVNSGGTLSVNTGSKISGNAYSNGGGVYVDGGTLTVNGGAISGNSSSSSGGGVYIASGMLTINSGEISGNSASYYGGGVYIAGSGTLTMNGGEISGNSASYYGGGGVYVDGGKISMTGGAINGNSSSDRGGGVYVAGSGTLTMTGGTISGNSASSYGGGVYINGGMWTMTGGEISGNSSDTGGGVYIAANGTWTMSGGGTISGNSSRFGGGAYIANGGTFIKMSGGSIYGSNASDSLKNTASSDSCGHAVYVNTSTTKIRNTTAGSSVTLNSGVNGSAGGWE
jgi:uncharacterized repeat protein (TIGR02543 family)